MDISITKKDVIWSYLAQFFNIASGFITLPLILSMLSTEEIAMNYLMMTVGTLVALIDFGFNPQFGRNVTYVFSGAQKLNKDGLIGVQTGSVNYHLLKGLIDVAKTTYRLMSLIVLVLMLTLGTWYIYIVTDSFSNVDNSFIIWILYSISTFFNIYFYYYSSLLTGSGQIKESKQALLANRLGYIILAYVMLLMGWGLMGVVLANLISPFLGRVLSHYYFYRPELRDIINNIKVTKEEKKELFNVIWYNAKKLGINFIGAYAITRFAMFIAGLYLSMEDIASYGLMSQLVSILVGVSNVFFSAFIPSINNYKVLGEDDKLIRNFARSQAVFFSLYIIGSLVIVLLGPYFLDLIKSNAVLPAKYILILYLIITLLENNHANFATVITAGNKVPFVSAALISGGFICVLDFLVLQFSSLGMFGIVLVPGLVQLAYNNWYWPKWVLDDYNMNISGFVHCGYKEIVDLIKRRKGVIIW
ncbi:MAG: polysaccharide biosynthesis protein [Mediterranea massiliensis]|nr:polysaccharide biosynthesis protein [Mediterranea massiliensis]